MSTRLVNRGLDALTWLVLLVMLSPVLWLVFASLQTDGQLSTGAMNLLNAIHALGFGAMWVTGANAYDPAVAAALGLHPPDCLVGFMFVGTPAQPQQPARRPDLSGHVRDWTAPDQAPDQIRG